MWVFELIQADIGTDGLAVIAKAVAIPLASIGPCEERRNYLPNRSRANPLEPMSLAMAWKEEDS